MHDKHSASLYSEEIDSIDEYFECITSCSLGDEGIECVTQCLEIHLKVDEES